MSTSKRMVIALGHDALGTNLPEQKTAVLKTAKVLAELSAAGYGLIITHSNGPQVGMIHTAMNEFSQAHPEYTPAPMSVCSAMSQGYIGYDLQNALKTQLLNLGISRNVSTILTQVCVDPYDEAFYHPSKVIGRTMNEEDAKLEEMKGNFVVEAEGGYRRIVAAPKPLDIVETDAIRALADAGQIVIACGGGGIPVLEQDNVLKGASAVIEKDLAAGKLAELTDAQYLMILTYEEQQLLDKSGEKTPLGHITAQKARQYIEEGQFGIGTKRPKFEAAADFVEKDSDRTAIITNLTSCKAALDGKTGTIITKS